MCLGMLPFLPLRLAFLPDSGQNAGRNFKQWRKMLLIRVSGAEFTFVAITKKVSNWGLPLAMKY